ncbi:hypothetical protein [Kineobactrum salinum]|uniref:hypothetical protein n=1 Tax=Kineobactrum salinum TaxID=2708301 RepID=UPI0018D90693|nr:hypothetical protein [Kineobactrum salinum]
MNIEPYNTVGLIPTVWGISRREDILHNIEHLRHMVKAACWLASLDLPVRLIALPEGLCRVSMTKYWTPIMSILHAPAPSISRVLKQICWAR